MQCDATDNFAPDIKDFTVAQVARMSQLSTETVRKLCKTGKIPGAWDAAVSGDREQWRIPRTAWDEFKKQRSAHAKDMSRPVAAKQCSQPSVLYPLGRPLLGGRNRRQRRH